MPGMDRDEESGRYLEKYPIEEFVEALESLGGMAGTQEVADEVGSSYQTAYYKLGDLEDEGRVHPRRVGSANLWVLVDDE
ncbi:FaeA/PapI family transcriptional regulator [Halegenticoccus tardaugens]|uniref:FaeA/PapI family transcriptional regulator n=1 Tax=Halegenticoccus tardaugens TaxID=2071624 RepID=UPI00100A4E0F|nr:FaeA/PapI family transcriptional regulator [Halegenticoccus tardaugens]